MNAIGSGSPHISAASQFPTQIHNNPQPAFIKHLACRVENFRQIRIFDAVEKSHAACAGVFFPTRIKSSAVENKNSNFHLPEHAASVAGAAGVAKWQTHRT